MTTSDSTALKQTRFKALRAEAHPFCLVCGQSNPFGLGVKFACEEDGSVSATFLGHPALEGFQGFLHGGVIASLLDGAMTNCLFAHGCAAMTGELNVRYREPVVIGEEMRIRAWIERSLPPLHSLVAELKQGDCVKAAATAKFVERWSG
ncbi:MAG: PaaI family thioesterase [Verrucomicrobiia bacterium]